MSRVGRKRTNKITLSAVVVPKVHDRRSTDLTRGHIEMAIDEVDDPYEQGEKIVVMRSLRDDPLRTLFVKKIIDEAQFSGGDAWRSDFETAERGPCAIDPTKEAVDGGKMPDPITESQQRAHKRLNEANRKLGQIGCALVGDILLKRWPMKTVAEMRGLSGSRWEDYFSKRFQEALDTLALVYGFANGSRPDTTHR